MLSSDQIKELMKIIDNWITYKRYIMEIPGISISVNYHNDMVFSKIGEVLEFKGEIADYNGFIALRINL